MTGYTVRRLLLIIPTVLIVSMIIFFIFHLLPGDAALIQVTEGGTSSMSVKQYERALEELGLDRPAVERYGDWIWRLVQGDGGNSLVTGQPVFEELAKSLPVTLELAILASIMGIVISIPIGVMSAVKQDGLWDYLGRLFTVCGLALPSFLAGSMLLLIMSVYFNWLPPLEYTPFLEAPMNNLAHVIWPATILALHETAILVRMTRSSMLEVLRQDYMRTAHAKGLAPRIAVVRQRAPQRATPGGYPSGAAAGQPVGGIRHRGDHLRASGGWLTAAQWDTGQRLGSRADNRLPHRGGSLAAQPSPRFDLRVPRSEDSIPIMKTR